MKSTVESLKNRGYLDKEIICGDEEFARRLLKSEKAVERTMGVRTLKELELYNSADVVNEVLSILKKEKALYTRLEICEFLKCGDERIVPLMIDYVGEIGSNQHKVLPKAVSKKKSYPLPRDIISRTLANMDKSIFNQLIEVIREGNKRVIREVIDAVGFLVFYNRSLCTDKNLGEILLLADKYREDKIIFWKVIICLSAFKQREGKEFLERIVSSKNGILRMEAKRSLEFYM